MGYEMLHREVITQQELELLLKSSDVMPFWRDKLTQISFSPLTRVDVRRMHSVGVLSEAEVTRAYKDLGYDEVNAKRLTDFTVALNTDDDADEDLDLNDLTRNNVIQFFRDGIFTRQDALNVLLATEVSEDAANLLLNSAELQIEAEIRKQQINLVLERAKGGVISFDDAQSELDRLGLAELEKQKALNDLVTEQTRRNKIPPKGDLDKFLKAGIIDDETYLDFIGRLGFSETWAKRYLTLNKGVPDNG